ncbi:MAG: alpha/beta hydrolase [Alphaproteobacteria bacterium]
MPEVIITGPEGRLEGRYHQSKIQNAPIALVLHPHPQHGGTMNNKVSYSMYQTFAQAGFSVLRFNFRGVGKSEGVYDKGEGELADAATALDWLHAQNPNASQTWISGFSFGSWLCMQLLMRRPEITSFIAVSPPADKYDFSFLAPCPVSGLMIQGTDDSVVSADSVENLTQKLEYQRNISVEYVEVSGADHFFKGKIDALTGAARDYIDGYLR